MSLVDYASSSDEDEPKAPNREQENSQSEEIMEKPRSFRVPAAPAINVPEGNSALLHRKELTVASTKSESSEWKLPDASLLLNSPALPLNVFNASDQSFQVSASMVQGTARKRVSSTLPDNVPLGKVSKGSLPHSKNVPDTLGGRLLPPQLVGRSNVVTEDISKLFVKRNANLSTD